MEAVTIERDNIVDFTQAVWTTVLGMEIQPGEAAAPARPTLTGTVRIFGAWDGEVTIECSESFARWAAARMFEASEASMEEVRDALGELANMVGGNLKALLPGPSKLSVPAVGEGGGGAAGEGLVNEVRLTCRGEPISVKVRAVATTTEKGSES